MEFDAPTLKLMVDEAYQRWRACEKALTNAIMDGSSGDAAQAECEDLRKAYKRLERALTRAQAVASG